MPNTKSATKMVRVQKRKTLRNKIINSALKTTFKNALVAIEEKDKEKALKAVHIAESDLDKAVAKGIIHRNKAARKKSRLMARFNSLEG